MLEWLIFVGILFLTGWVLKAFFFTPFGSPSARALSPITMNYERTYAPSAIDAAAVAEATAAAAPALTPEQQMALLSEEPPAKGPTKAPLSPQEKARLEFLRTYRPEGWCFVGENTLGRFCVRSASCGPLERFPSREACEYTEASALPLGITEEGGLRHRPFMTPHAVRYTTF